jgi:2,4-dienoyl-CoA reductase-like NADH-dependent reductase (Old Yellow Enzyme family)
MYAEAAQRAVGTGFDILYVHAPPVFPAHALSRHFNRRRLWRLFENRARF